MKKLGVLLFFAFTMAGAAACSSSCGCAEQWPQLLVGVIPPVGFTGNVKDALGRLEVRLWDGTTFDNVLADGNSCPQSVVSLPCDVAVFDGINSQSVRLTAISLTGEAVSMDVPIKARDHCGANVAYATIRIDDSLHFGETRYVSPCP